MQRLQKRMSKLQKIARALREHDPDIIEVVHFGSGVYAPRLARDIDLLVTTRAKKPDDVYWQAADAVDDNVDILVRTQGEPVSPQIALAVRAFSKTLWGDGQT